MSADDEIPPTIMVVDDDVDQRALIRLVAESQGLFIQIKRGGTSALQELYDRNYDVDAIIIDLSMPDMDGITLTKHIRQNENLRSKANPAKIFWFTAWPFDLKNPNDPIVLGAQELGVDKIYSKGCDMVQIIYEVKEIVDVRHEPSAEMPAAKEE